MLQFKTKIKAAVATILLPFIHLGIIYKLLLDPTKEVLTDVCSCDCWDMFFKGSYESGVAGYKDVYFNTNIHTFLIWASSFLFFIASYESVKYIINLRSTKSIRTPMFLIFLSSLYPNYYCWWMLFNSINDHFYGQIVHQTIFSATEFFSTGLALINMNLCNSVQPKHMALIVIIALYHIIMSLRDQFIWNVLLITGMRHQISRDIGFMMSDVVNSSIAFWQLKKSLKSNLQLNQTIFDKTEILLIIWIFSFLTLILIIF